MLRNQAPAVMRWTVTEEGAKMSTGAMQMEMKNAGRAALQMIARMLMNAGEREVWMQMAVQTKTEQEWYAEATRVEWTTFKMKEKMEMKEKQVYEGDKAILVRAAVWTLREG